MLREVCCSLDFRAELSQPKHSHKIYNSTFAFHGFGFNEKVCDATVSASIIHTFYGTAGTCLGCQMVLAC